MPEWWEYPVTQGFGPTDEPLDSGYAGHAHFNKGIDYGVPRGTPITAPVAGKVIAAGPGNEGWGTRVWVQDAEGHIHNFGHLDSAAVRVGDFVQPGQLVGASGNTGKSTGPHLSYDVWTPSGEYIDPGRFLGGPPMAPPAQTPPPQVDEFGFPISPGAAPGGGGTYSSSAVQQPWTPAPAPSSVAAGPLQTPSAQAAPPAAPSPVGNEKRIPIPGTEGYMVFVPEVNDYLVFMPTPDTNIGSPTFGQTVMRQSWRSAAGGASAAEASKNIRVNQDTGLAYVVDNQGNIVRPAPEFNENPTSSAATGKPDGFTDYDAAGNPFVWKGGKLVPAPPGTPKKGAATTQRSSFEQAADRLVAGQRTLQGAQQPAQAGSPAPSSGESQEPMFDFTGPGAAYRSQSQDVYAPNDIFGQPGRFVGQEIPTDERGGSTLLTAGPNSWADTTLRTAGLIPTGDIKKDYDAALGAAAQRSKWLAEHKDPLVVQSMFDTLNRGTDVYSRAKAVSAEERAADQGARLPAVGTDNLTASQLSSLLQPLPETPGVQYEQDELGQWGPMGFAEGGEVEVDPDVPLSMRGASKPRIHIGDSAPYRTDTVSREMHGDRFIRDAQGGPWQTETRFGVPQWEDFTNKMGGAATGGWNQVMQRSTFLKSLEDYFGRPVPLAHWGASVAPPPMSMIQGGQRRTFSFANGGDMLTDEPIVGMGTYSGQPRFTLGEPNALTGEPTREVLSVKPLEPSVPMPMSPPMGGQMPMSPPAQPPQATPEILRLFLQNTRRPVRMGVT